MKILDVYKSKENAIVQVNGWIRFNRVSKNVGFIELFDGSNLNGIQLVYKKSQIEIYEKLSQVTLFSALQIKGKVIADKKNGREVLVESVIFCNEPASDFPLGKKEHGLEFLRQQAHLRVKTKLFQAVMTIRSTLSLSIHDFFAQKSFHYLNSPIITKNDAEGAGESFFVKTIKNKNFWSSPASLSVSGQLHAEAYAQAFTNVYTFAPTFRAENSNTTRHASEFWMIEPEVAFADYNDLMDLGQELIKFVIKKVLLKHEIELKFLANFSKVDLLTDLETIVNNDYEKISYKKAIKILQNAIIDGVNFEQNKIEFGIDFGIEHEKYLASVYAKKPIFIYDYPLEIKSFYMYQNDDQETVRGFDLLVPRIGELIGGSQRENSYEKLIQAMKIKKIKSPDLDWYLELRKNGFAPSSGFGLGLERLVMLVTGMENIRDVLPFPRTPGDLNF
ncbi:MAG: asparagine--tRNA ligase [Mycoplasmataceae bacterium]|nr:asparagine--tRNA ligase [Mycoplasmataceae bacterium]